MRDADPNAALRESALPTLLTYTGHEGILSDTTQAETIAAVESLPDGRVVLEPFAEGNHNYLSEDAAPPPRWTKRCGRRQWRFWWSI